MKFKMFPLQRHLIERLDILKKKKRKTDLNNVHLYGEGDTKERPWTAFIKKIPGEKKRRTLKI